MWKDRTQQRRPAVLSQPASTLLNPLPPSLHPPCTLRYMQGLSRRGLHRTALECCKLLLGLDSDDPLGALCTIDYLALRAGR